MANRSEHGCRCVYFHEEKEQEKTEFSALKALYLLLTTVMICMTIAYVITMKRQGGDSSEISSGRVSFSSLRLVDLNQARENRLGNLLTQIFFSAITIKFQNTITSVEIMSFWQART